MHARLSDRSGEPNLCSEDDARHEIAEPEPEANFAGGIQSGVQPTSAGKGLQIVFKNRNGSLVAPSLVVATEQESVGQRASSSTPSSSCRGEEYQLRFVNTDGSIIAVEPDSKLAPELGPEPKPEPDPNLSSLEEADKIKGWSVRGWRVVRTEIIDGSPRDRWVSEEEHQNLGTSSVRAGGRGVATYQLHVRNVGVDGWDGTDEGVGTFENEAAVSSILSVFGTCVNCTIYHRIQDQPRANTSWALVTMGDQTSVERALEAPSVLAGETELQITRFDHELAQTSTGAMAEHQKQDLLNLHKKVGRTAELEAQNAELGDHMLSGIGKLLHNPLLVSKMAGFSPIQKSKIIPQKLLALAKTKRATAGQTIIETGDKAEEVFFLQRGTLEVLVDRELKGTMMEPGRMFGESCFNEEIPRRTCDIRAAEHTTYIALSAQEVLHVIGTEIKGFRELVSEAMEEELQVMFNKLDPDKSGSLNRAEVAVLVKQMEKEEFEEADIDYMMQEMDTDGTGVVSFEEFCLWWVADEDLLRQEEYTGFDHHLTSAHQKSDLEKEFERREKRRKRKAAREAAKLAKKAVKEQRKEIKRQIKAGTIPLAESEEEGLPSLKTRSTNKGQQRKKAAKSTTGSGSTSTGGNGGRLSCAARSKSAAHY